MKKTFFVFLLLFCSALSGCAASRTVKNNTFLSSSPALRVTVASEFTYVNNITYTEYYRGSKDGRKLWNEVDAYSFIKADPKNSFLIAKGIVIGISETETFYAGNLFNTEKDLEHGRIGLADENYEFSTQLFYPNLSEHITASLRAAGYIMPQCILKKQHARIAFGNNQYAATEFENRKRLKFIHYWEDAALSGYDCDKWKDAAELNDTQKAYLKEFNKRAAEAFRVIKGTN